MKLIQLGLLIMFVQFCFGQTTDTYQYDGNGNMIADSYNGIAFIQYDIDNRPIAIYKTDGTKIEYAYDASGERVRKTVGGVNTYYVHGADGKTEAVVKDDPAATVFHIDDIGRAERQGSSWIRSYYLKDHLGSIRMTLSDNGSVIGYDDYYPFGMIMPGRSGNSGNGAGRYKFTGKERDVETQFDYFGARYYDARIGRFLKIDRFDDKYPSVSPYSYAANSPMVFIDMNGDSLWMYDENGQRMLYNSGMKYEGESKIISQLVSMLNNVGGTKLGGVALGGITGSENNYNIYFGHPSTTGVYVGNGSLGGGDIALRSNADWGLVGHEVWHSFQNENGSSGSSIFSEVEAYAAQASMQAEANGGILPNFGRSGTDIAGFYNTAMQGLVGSSVFNQSAFDNAIKYFIDGSTSNSNGDYNGFNLRIPNERVLIKNYYPLVRRP